MNSLCSTASGIGMNHFPICQASLIWRPLHWRRLFFARNGDGTYAIARCMTYEYYIILYYITLYYIIFYYMYDSLYIYIYYTYISYVVYHMSNIVYHMYIYHISYTYTYTHIMIFGDLVGINKATAQFVACHRFPLCLLLRRCSCQTTSSFTLRSSPFPRRTSIRRTLNLTCLPGKLTRKIDYQ